MVIVINKVCTPTHKSALIANATTIFNLFNINPFDYTYLKSHITFASTLHITYILHGILHGFTC